MKKSHQKIFDLLFSKYDKTISSRDMIIALRYADDIDGHAKLKPMFRKISRSTLSDLVVEWLENYTDFN